VLACFTNVVHFKWETYTLNKREYRKLMGRCLRASFLIEVSRVTNKPRTWVHALMLVKVRDGPKGAGVLA
jgi:hypothetical protein